MKLEELNENKWIGVVNQDVADNLHDMKLDYKSGGTESTPSEKQAAINVAIMYRESGHQMKSSDEWDGRMKAMKELYPKAAPHMTKGK